MRSHPRFTAENTEGYTTADLQRVNLRYEGAAERHFTTEETDDERASRPKSVLDAIAEAVLSDFDAEQSPPAPKMTDTPRTFEQTESRYVADTIRLACAQNIEAARMQGYDGPDRDYEQTRKDCDAVVDIVRVMYRRMPTRGEWRDAGYLCVGSRHYSEAR